MNWKDLAETVGAAAPMLGTLLAGPAGGAVGAIIASTLGTRATPDAVASALSIDPQAAVKLAEIESNERVKLQQMVTDQAIAEIEAAKQNTTDVNTTMQAESRSEHWQTYSWRPMIGFAVAFNVAASSLLVLALGGCLMFGTPAATAAAAAAMAHLPMILGGLAGINGTVLPILGIASWFRGRMQADPSIPATVSVPLLKPKA